MGYNDRAINKYSLIIKFHLAADMKAKLNERVSYIFNKMDTDHNKIVTLVWLIDKIFYFKVEYQEAVIKDSTLLDIFEFI